MTQTLDPKTYESYLRRGINQERLNAILKFAGNSILDVGCGGGAYVLKLADQYQIRGVDYQKFPTWAKMPDLFSLSDAHRLNLDDDSVDTICSFEALEHLENPAEALKEYYRVCKKNIILTVPNCHLTDGMEKSQLIYYHWIDRTHQNFFEMEDISRLVMEAGFKISQKYYINQISLIHLFQEVCSLDRRNLISKIYNKVLQKILSLILNKSHQKYYLTCLIVGEKDES